MPKVIKPSNPFTNVCWLRLTFSAPPQILAASTVFSPNSRNEEMMVMVSGATAAGLFEIERLLSTSCNKQGQRSSE